jgi:hypothetical protein
VVVATIATLDDCPTAADTQTVRVVAGRRHPVTLSPRPCGALSFDASPAGARYTITALPVTDSSYQRNGLLPANGLTLVAGRYARTIHLSKCTNYADTISVEANRPTRPPRVQLLCR